MADKETDTPALHGDTQAWFDLWSKYMASLDKAYNDLEVGLTGVGNKGDRPNQSAGLFAAEIGQNEAFGKVSTTPYHGVEKEGDDGFPKAESLISEYLSLYKTEKTQEKLIALYRQLNVLEAFRKRRFSEKQTKSEALQHVQFMRTQGTQLRMEFEKLMLFIPEQPVKETKE